MLNIKNVIVYEKLLSETTSQKLHVNINQYGKDEAQGIHTTLYYENYKHSKQNSDIINSINLIQFKLISLLLKCLPLETGNHCSKFDNNAILEGGKIYLIFMTAS